MIQVDKSNALPFRIRKCKNIDIQLSSIVLQHKPQMHMHMLIPWTPKVMTLSLLLCASDQTLIIHVKIHIIWSTINMSLIIWIYFSILIISLDIAGCIHKGRRRHYKTISVRTTDVYKTDNDILKDTVSRKNIYQVLKDR
jgi:hypothetical protein